MRPSRYCNKETRYCCAGQLADLQLENPFLNAASDDKACHMDGLVLPKPVNPILCLLFYRRIPPAVPKPNLYTGHNLHTTTAQTGILQQHTALDRCAGTCTASCLLFERNKEFLARFVLCTVA